MGIVYAREVFSFGIELPRGKRLILARGGLRKRRGEWTAAN
jgi:hypothetical protein